ncbi:response regulator transcription factor [Rhodoligotrophos ferricapiens]|uniref:response regulator transcription factor n=1 Tax=Rhodoligotrophos ferricapiens TaxID=3069264 RepID=UPI00315DF6D6
MENDEPHGSPSIAVVDNDASALHAIVALLGSLGFGASEFASAAEFLNSRREDKTACLIADVQMPGMTGLELHEHLTAKGRIIPTILTTAYPNEATRIRARKAGILCYLAKPVGPDALLGCVRAALARAA